MVKTDASDDVTYIGAGGVRLVGERWKPGTGWHPQTGIALLLHGGGQTRHSWHNTAARLAAHGWTAITLDARGHGTVSGRATATIPSMRSQVTCARSWTR